MAEDLNFGAEGNHGDGNQRHGHGQEGRQQIDKFVDVRRKQIFLGDELDDVRERLQQPVRAHPRGPQAHLNVRDHFALDPLQIGQRSEKDKSDDSRFDDADDEEFHQPSRRLSRTEFNILE